MNFNELSVMAKQCEQNLRNIGIPVGNVTELTVNNRTSSRLGRCTKRVERLDFVDGKIVAQETFSIEISGKILHDVKEVENTLYHELIHTCPSCLNHGDRWQRYGEIAEAKLNLSSPITRCKAVDKTEEYISQFKYLLKCECCGALVPKDRMCGVVKNPELYTHRNCGGKFVRVR